MAFFSRVMHEERKMMASNIQLQTALCVSTMKLKNVGKVLLCYSELIDVHFKPNTPIFTGIVNLLYVRNDTKES